MKWEHNMPDAENEFRRSLYNTYIYNEGKFDFEIYLSVICSFSMQTTQQSFRVQLRNVVLLL